MDDQDKRHSEQYAVALRYEPGRDDAPRVTAAGRGELARKIKEMAENSGVPVYEDAALAQTLYKLGVNTEIPPELYEVIAQILVYVARIDRNKTPHKKF
ncbi:EscU/YscU/HrcU family type III secretion system export apparatus switch protein [Desulfallas sp. Bu1-1]|uniref:EscU/YscU/HrcU family type III secretion system export apparatus switch protein n=1 Tax=Desulfallas sp. Bu1-1 TaxID=2787620 RepID=UPI0018A0C860|nr:EscU/YscU/HrcU family type III secretion system export apparatus switch protein [Desulfallas sp. Bu1-1]MBF7083467.1 EscU/YscU/HrcU family type III secretion system export apparatus switch protein [Desulfallas sp. Bu1-1]